MAQERSFSIKSMDRIRDKKGYKSMVGSARRAVLLIFLLSFAVFVAIAIIGMSNEGFDEFIATFKSIDLSYYLAALVIIFVSYTMRYPKWSMYLRRLGVHIPTRQNYMIYMSMYSMDMTPGRWGRAIVSYTINQLSKVKFAVTFPAVVADIFTDFLGFAVITDAMAVMVGKFVFLSFLLTFLLMVPFFFVYIQTPFNYVRDKFWKFRGRFGFLKKLDVIFYTATLYFQHNKKLRGSAFVYSMLLTIPSMFLNGMALYVTMMAFGIPMNLSDIPTVIFIFSSSLVLGMITGIPGTLGVTDAALISQLQYFYPATITLGLASAITIFFRIASVWFVQGFGLSAFIHTLKYWKD
jgi:uncharacterized protein (TIRG00374 family)